MTDYHIIPSKLKGTITVPSSKSQTLRAILFGSLAEGKTRIEYPLASPDSEAMIRAMESFGAKIDVTRDEIHIEGLGGKLGYAEDVIDAGNSGIVFRFVSAVAGLSQYPIVITGDHSLRHQRPIAPLLHGLSQLGVRAISTKQDGFAPVIIQGPIRPGSASISGQDSQPVSGLLIAAALGEGPIEIFVEYPGEQPWVQMTLDWFDRLGIRYRNQDYKHYWIEGNQRIQGFNYTVPGDFSTAAFPLVAALITGSEMTLNNLDFSDSQGDKKLVDVLIQMGAKIEIDHSSKKVHVMKNGALKGLSIDMNEMIDAVPALAVLACFADGKTHLRNAAIARTKECDRLGAMTSELKKMGAKIEEHHDGLTIRSSKLRGVKHLCAHQDHRVAMALATAALAAEGESSILSIECVNKTYPGFQKDFYQIGALIEAIP